VADRLTVNAIPEDRGMKHLLLVGAIALLSACAPTQPQAPPPPAARPSPPEPLYRLVLATPPGQGAIDFRRERRVQDGVATAVYAANGAITADDDVGQWRFAYTKTSLEGPAAALPAEWVAGIHAISLTVTNTSASAVEVDWERTTFVDAAGRSERVIHRGVQLNQKAAPMAPTVIAAGTSLKDFIFPGERIVFSAPGGRASLWNAPAILERLAPGGGFSLVIGVKRGETSTLRTFRFTAIPLVR
jgi:hypothetical protein